MKQINLKQIIKIQALTLFLMLPSSLLPAQNQSKWELIYENDSDGKAIQGNLNELMQAIRGGAEIRVGWLHQSPEQPIIKVEHLANAKFVTIMSDQTVFAQIDPIIGQTPDFKKQLILLKENLEWSFIASSNGLQESMLRNLSSGEVLDHQRRRWGIKWYVRY